MIIRYFKESKTYKRAELKVGHIVEVYGKYYSVVQVTQDRLITRGCNNESMYESSYTEYKVIGMVSSIASMESIKDLEKRNALNSKDLYLTILGSKSVVIKLIHKTKDDLYVFENALTKEILRFNGDLLITNHKNFV